MKRGDCRLQIAEHRLLVVVFVLATGRCEFAVAQDDVVHQRSGIKLRGRITAQDSSGVWLLYGANKEPKLIPAEKIERVEVTLTPDQEDGERLFQEGDYRGAAEKLAVAIRVENRAWLRGRMESSLVTAYVALGDSVAAMDAFLAAWQEDGSKVAWGAAPLCWLPEPPDAATRQHAQSLLRAAQPMQQLLGASFLLGTDQASAAREALSKLTTYRDERISQMARLQLWRWDLANAGAEDVAAWQQQVGKLPAELRGGANFVIGLAHQRIGAHEDAALAFLWPALVYRTDSRLSRRAALLAADCLVKTSQTSEARQMYQELVSRFPRTSEAVTALSRLNELKE